MLPLALLGLGIFGLWGGTLLAVRGAVELSDRYQLSRGFVGLVVLAIGTDLPELVVALGGSWQQLQGVDASGLILGASVGSAIAQGTLALGVAGLIAYLPVAPRMLRRDLTTLLLTIGLVFALAVDGSIGRLDGFALLIVYAIYFVALVQAERVGMTDGVPGAPEVARPWLSLAIGMVIVTVSAHLVVTEGIAVAEAVGVSQSLVAVILVGAGTSIPELALSARAAYERQAGLAVGNVVGSNIFDLLVPVGAGAAIHPLAVDPQIVRVDLPALAVLMTVLAFFLHRRRGLQRNEAAVLIALYLSFLVIRTASG